LNNEIKKTEYLNRIMYRSIAVLLTFVITCGCFYLFPAKKIYPITLRELSNQIEALSDEEEALIEEVLSVETLIEIKKNEINKLDERIISIENELEDLVFQRIALEKAMEEKKEILESRIIYSYKYSRNNIIKMITTAKNINEFITILYLFRNIMRRDAELIESIRLDKESHERVMRKFEEKKKESELTKKDREEEQKKLESSLEKAEMLLDKVENERSSVQSTLAAIKERIARIQPQGITLSGEWTMTATAYYAGGGGLNGNGITATGLRARKGIIAVDPGVIPLGTTLYIDGYGTALAADTGGWIKGNRVDLCFDTLEECYRYGRRKIYVYLVEN
jgi:3D (Asp-Asp-Asp) domain-containing protein/peptidoglycan hydrolase CwlO-like protein